MAANDHEDDARTEYEDARDANAAMPPIDFNILVLSLSTSALMQMGEATDQEPMEPDLALARQTIDLLGVLEEKTRGNLSGAEERLLQQVLNDLRVRFVRKHRNA